MFREKMEGRVKEVFHKLPVCAKDAQNGGNNEIINDYDSML